MAPVFLDMSRKRKSPPQKRWGKILRTVFLAVLATGLLAVGGVVGWLAITVDTEADAALFEASQGSRTTRLYYNAERSGSVYLAREWESERLVGSENAIWCPIARMPKDLKNAFLAAEDHRFFSHNGIDWLRTVKAVANQLFHFDSRFGGSGITQQLVKNITGEREVSAVRKLREGWRALALERRFTKEEILELYLNIVPMGENSIGVAAGAEQYFGKSVEELTLSECASLAAVINAPVRYDPVRNPEENRARRNTVLQKMQEYGMITAEHCASAMGEELRLSETPRHHSTKVLSWYTETVIDDVLSDLTEKKGYSRAAALRLLFGGGLEIYTLADPAVQRAMEEGFSSVSVQEGVQYAGVVADPATGDILGIVGGAGEKRGNRLLNYSAVPLAPGSALKPLSVYAPALDAGLITSATVFDDVPLEFLGEEMRAWPKNSPGVYDGLCDLGTAIATSKNTVAVRTLRLLGKERSYATLTRDLGFSHLVRKAEGEGGSRLTDLGEAPLALGQLTYGVTVRELTAAYTTLAGDGTFRRGRTYLAVYDKDGNMILSNEGEAHRAFSPQTASIMTKQLERVVNGGTANGVRLPGGIPVAGKTGTTTAGRDKWFVGYSPYYLCGIWCGSIRDTVSVAGKPQLAVFNRVMGELHREIADSGHAIRAFSLAPGVFECRFCRDGGGLMTVDCLHDPRGDRGTVGWFTASTLPRHSCSCHVGVLCGEEGGVLPGVSLGHVGDGLRRTGLIRVTDRSFPVEVAIRDAQYVYRPLGDAVPSPGEDTPFFGSTLAPGVYVGRSPTADGRQFNALYRKREEEDPFSFYRPLLGGE